VGEQIVLRTEGEQKVIRPDDAVIFKLIPTVEGTQIRMPVPQSSGICKYQILARGSGFQNKTSQTNEKSFCGCSS
jgi:hypothetical protein